jgi:hypothetical protein
MPMMAGVLLSIVLGSSRGRRPSAIKSVNSTGMLLTLGVAVVAFSFDLCSVRAVSGRFPWFADQEVHVGTMG